MHVRRTSAETRRSLNLDWRRSKDARVRGFFEFLCGKAAVGCIRRMLALLRVTKKIQHEKRFMKNVTLQIPRNSLIWTKNRRKLTDLIEIISIVYVNVSFFSHFFRFLIHLKKFNYLSHPTTIMKWWNWLTMLHKIWGYVVCGEFQWIDTSSKQNSLQRHLLILWQLFIALKSTDGALGGFALMTSFGIWALLECHWGTYVVGHKKRATFRRSRNNRNKLTKSDDEDDSFKPKVTSTFKEE